MKNFEKIFVERLKALRATKNLTQRGLAEAMGISNIVIARYENGTRKPAFEQLIALADYFNVSLDYLVGRSDDPERH